jgi:hypothetical protein
MFTTTENRKLVGAVFGWLSLGIGALAILNLAAAVGFRLLHGLNRQSDAGLALASGIALFALVFGAAAGGYSWFLLRARLAKVALVLCLFPLPTSLVINWFAGGHW